ncbi:MAG: class I SAM-dependent methyltransferase [Polyangiales bacterium]
MSAPCPLCEGLCRRRFEIAGHTVWRCDRCDLERVYPLPDAAEVEAVYRDGYFSGPGAGYDDYFERERAVAARKSAARLDRAAELGVRRGRALDVGCASGYFLEAALARGFAVRGVEPSEEARAHADDRVRGSIVASLGDDEGPFDLITFWDVLEHLADPVATLAETAPRLAPGGVLGVVVPVLGSVNTRLAPRTWDQYKPPEHLWFFSPRAMRAALSRAGLEVVLEEPAWTRHARFIDPEHRRRDPLTRALRGLDAALHRGLAAIAGRALLVDSVAFYARRRPA